MFTIENLERWIYWLDDCINTTNLNLKQIKITSPIYNRQLEKRDTLVELRKTLSGIYDSMSSDGSI